MNFSSVKSIYKAAYQKALKYKRGVGWILALVVASLVLILYQFDVLERLELLTLDFRFNLRHKLGYMKLKPSEDIVFIDMAEDSLAVLGAWPWPRKSHAYIIDALAKYKPKVIAFDVAFFEPQNDYDDNFLEKSMREAGVVYLPSQYDLGVRKLKDLYRGEGASAIHEPLPRFMARVMGSGHINATPDQDGTLRRVHPVLSYAGKRTYQFGIAIGSRMLGVRPEDIHFDARRHIILMKLPGERWEKIPLDRNNQLIVNWMGKWEEKEFPHYSYIDVIRSYAQIKEDKKPIIDLNVFKDKVCIIGLTAAGTIDIKPIPIESAYPAVGTNAMVINSVLTGNFIREASHAVNLLIVLVLSVLATLFLCNLRAVSGIVLTILGIIFYGAFSAALFVLFNIVIVTFYPAVGIFAAYVLTASYTQILQSLERARLFKQATRDGLTHLYNIRHFNLLLEAEFRNAAVYKLRNLSVIMADLDNFKKLNDTYGHQAGDIVLREVAAIIQSKCRQTDVVGRYGGEEFVVMLTGARIKDAADIAEKIRAAVEDRKFKFRNAAYSTTISIGVAEYTNESARGELVHKADTALYKAKGEGKNRVCAYSEGIA